MSNAIAVRSGYTMDFTTQIEYAQRDDGVWFKRFQQMLIEEGFMILIPPRISVLTRRKLLKLKENVLVELSIEE